MQIYTPTEVAETTGNKYLGVLVADRSQDEKKLTTRALEALVSDDLSYRLVRRRRQET
jgi:hypothetical protein